MNKMRSVRDRGERKGSIQNAISKAGKAGLVMAWIKKMKEERAEDNFKVSRL